MSFPGAEKYGCIRSILPRILKSHGKNYEQNGKDKRSSQILSSLIIRSISFQMLPKYHLMRKNIHHQYDRARRIAW
jgi:hypothetical protein